MKDLDRAFPPTPECVEDAIYEGVRRARRRALMRRRLQRLAAAAAVVAVLVGAFSFLHERVRPDAVSGPGGQRALSGPVARSASPDPTDALPSPAPTRSASPDPTSELPSPAPMQSASPRPTPTPTPEPTEASQTRAEVPADGDLSAVSDLPAIAEGEMADAPIATAEAAFAAVSPEPEPAALTEASIPAATLPPASAVELPAAEVEQLALSLGSYIASDAYADAETALSIDPLEYGFCFSTATGTWFHTVRNCMGMAGAQLRTLREALAMGQTFCPACIAFAAEDGDLAWSREEDAYYHASSFCAGVEDETAEAETALTFVDRARLQGKLPCPNCVTLEQTTPAVLTGQLYCTSGGEWVHAQPNCNGMRQPMGCTLAQALEMGKSICPVCIGTDCIYINGIVWEPETGQLLISADTCTSVSCVDPISGAYIDVSAMDAVSTGLNSWDEAMLSSAAAAGGMPLRVDTCELNIACDAGDSTAATEWTDAGGRHLRLLFDGVTEEEASLLELSIAVTERFYCLWDGLLFVRSAPAEEARFAPLSDALNYVYDDTGNCSRFAPGNMLEAWDWTQAAAVELSWAIEGMGADAHIALYSLDAISGSADDMVILEARTPANVTIRPDFGGARRVSAGMRAEGDELVYTAILSGAQADAVFEDPSLLGFAEMPVANAY